MFQITSTNSRAPLQLALRVVVVIAAAATAAVQASGNSESRTTRGTVLDKNENAAPSSVVYLLNWKTQPVKTYIAENAGNCRSSGLKPNVSCQVHTGRSALTSFNAQHFELRFPQQHRSDSYAGRVEGGATR
jgi:hypothetical protein